MSAAPGQDAATAPRAAVRPAAPTHRAAAGPRSALAGRLAGLAPSGVAALPLLVLVVCLGTARWAPTGDEAWIAWRSWDVFAGPSPLVGPFTQATGAAATPVFEPGPLLFWVLSIPTHLLPSSGPAIAALAWSALCVVLACVAAGRAGGPRAAWCTAAGLLLLDWSLSALVDQAPAWNAYAGLLPFAALLVIAAVVAAGRVGWLPVVVVISSFVAQTHLMFAPPAAGVLLLAATSAAVSWWRRPGLAADGAGRGSTRWMVFSGLAVVLCWWPAVYQQLTGRPGNLGALLHAVLDGSGGPTLGWRRALGTLGGTLGPVPGWLRPPSALGSLADPSGTSTIAGVVVLLATAAVCALAIRDRSRGLAACAGVATVSAIGACWAIAGVFARTAGALAYIRYVTWPVALLSEAVLVWGLALLVQRWRRASAAHDAGRYRERDRSRRAEAVVAGAVVAAALLLAVTAAAGEPSAFGLTRDRGRGAAIAMSNSVADLLGPPSRDGQRVTVVVAEPGGLTTVILLMATGYRLRTMGWTPALPSPWNQVLDRTYSPRPHDAVLGVGPPPVGAQRLGAVEVPLSGDAASVTATRAVPVWLLPAS